MSDIRKARDIFYQHRPSAPPQPAAPGPTKTAHGGSDPSAIDPRVPEFANLRNFQRALMRQITDAGFRQRFMADSNVVMDEYPMAPEWKRRLEGCNQERVGHMAFKWPETVRNTKDVEEDLKRIEWRAWAAQSNW